MLLKLQSARWLQCLLLLLNASSTSLPRGVQRGAQTKEEEEEEEGQHAVQEAVRPNLLQAILVYPCKQDAYLDMCKDILTCVKTS